MAARGRTNRKARFKRIRWKRRRIIREKSKAPPSKTEGRAPKFVHGLRLCHPPDKVETSKNYQGKIKSPALQNRGQGTQNRLTIYVRATRPILEVPSIGGRVRAR